jgi:MinD-like ATPase involved in chromosome partitioning or flagellar assembly
VTKIISIHSFRGGTGKSNTTANIAALLADEGLRVGAVDADVQSPGLHVLFGLRGDEVTTALNDYLWDKASISDTARPVLQGQLKGELFLIPSSIKADEIVQVLRQGYDMRLLTAAFRQLSEELRLDVLLIDTHPGLNEETLFSLAISTAVVVVMRPDQQDFEGTGVTIEVARSLEVPHLMIIVNKTPPDYDFDQIKADVERTFQCPVGAVLPHSDTMMKLASSGVFALKYPDDPISKSLRDIARRLAEA